MFTSQSNAFTAKLSAHLCYQVTPRQLQNCNGLASENQDSRNLSREVVYQQTRGSKEMGIAAQIECLPVSFGLALTLINHEI